MNTLKDFAEQKRLEEARVGRKAWKQWGPYLSERQWGTVREDYSEGGDAWGYFPHEQARSRAYRWGEDGLAGVCDDKQRLCLALAVWNERDAILKERLFGLTNGEGNHGEDVKEYYFYLDSTPTHSYMKYLYKYPQRAYPYTDVVSTNRGRSRREFEYELIDTGIFDDDRYFDVFVEYAKEGPEDLLARITLINRGPEAARLRVLPTLWFRNTWQFDGPKPSMREAGPGELVASHPELGEYRFFCDGAPELLFTENETNETRLWGRPNASPYVKDAFHEYVVSGRRDAVNPGKTGTKAAAHYALDVPAGATRTIQIRLTRAKVHDAFGSFQRIFDKRLAEADEFYAQVTPPSMKEDESRVYRQALAGMLWSKQFYIFDGIRWLDEHRANPLQAGSRYSRNRDWVHMLNRDIISMPDKWEYPWYAAWDLAFHTIPLSIVDLDFAKQQLKLMLSGDYLHPNGQLPAYEWNFSDVNPPVHAFATLYIHRAEKALRGEVDVEFLEAAFNKLLLNFTWWVNRKDRIGKNVFEGGFLGLDNIGVFDRSAPLPTGGNLEQADGTAWMALFSQNMLELAIELATHDKTYEDMCVKFANHFLLIASAMNRPDAYGMWDEEDGFYYDLLRFPDGNSQRLKVRSLVGLLPLCATTIIEPEQRERIPGALARIHEGVSRYPDLKKTIHPTGPGHLGVNGRGIMALLTPERLRRVLARMLDENEFVSPYGLRSLSKFHERNPYVYRLGGQEFRVDYRPEESDTGMFGGNSNWRGPIWMPMNGLIIRALAQFYLYYGDDFKVECPTGSGRMMNLYEVSQEIGRRLEAIFLRSPEGRRPVYGGTKKFQTDPRWRDKILFYEYFHGDNGAGLGASHQTGWTGLIAKLMQMNGTMNGRQFLAGGVKTGFAGAARGEGRKHGANA